MDEVPHRDFYSDLIQAGKATVIVGGQYGSEAKGLAAAIVHQLARASVSKWCTTNAGAQAGHTTVLREGAAFVCYHLPTLGVLDPFSEIYINAGAIIDPDLFEREIVSVAAVTGEDVGRLRSRIHVDPCATVIHLEDQNAEAAGMGRIGSTMKGIGSALTQKIRRQNDAVAMNDPRITALGITIRRVDLMQEMTRRKRAVTIEIPQGTALSLNSSGHYPYTTSRECWLGQGLTDAAIHPSFLNQTVMVVRTLPIRVGNIYDSEGIMTGTSGPFPEDSYELDWELHLKGIEPERTTVTKRARRIATWSDILYARGLTLNRPAMVVLTFCNYLSFENLQLVTANMERIHNMHSMEPRIMYSWGRRSHQISPAIQACRPFCRPHDDDQKMIQSWILGEGDMF